MPSTTPFRSLQNVIDEGEHLLKKRPRCGKMLNDLTAATLIAKMCAAGFDVDREDAEECIRRMRIAVDTGIYPDALLGKAGRRPVIVV